MRVLQGFALCFFETERENLTETFSLQAESKRSEEKLIFGGFEVSTPELS